MPHRSGNLLRALLLSCLLSGAVLAQEVGKPLPAQQVNALSDKQVVRIRMVERPLDYPVFKQLGIQHTAVEVILKGGSRYLIEKNKVDGTTDHGRIDVRRVTELPSKWVQVEPWKRSNLRVGDYINMGNNEYHFSKNNCYTYSYSMYTGRKIGSDAGERLTYRKVRADIAAKGIRGIKNLKESSLRRVMKSIDRARSASKPIVNLIRDMKMRNKSKPKIKIYRPPKIRINRPPKIRVYRPPPVRIYRPPPVRFYRPPPVRFYRPPPVRFYRPPPVRFYRPPPVRFYRPPPVFFYRPPPMRFYRYGGFGGFRFG